MKIVACLSLSEKCFDIVRLNSKNTVTGLDSFVPCFNLQQQHTDPQNIFILHIHHTVM